MKPLAIGLLALTVLCGGLLCYGLFNADLRVVAQGMQAVPASDRAAEFEALRQSARQGSLLGTLLQSDDMGPAEDYSFYVYSLRLQNNGLVSAEMVETQLSPAAGDALFYGPREEIIIPPGQSRDVWCVLLTRGAPSPVRDLSITYYLWGHPQEVKYTYDDAK